MLLAADVVIDDDVVSQNTGVNLSIISFYYKYVHTLCDNNQY